jgi:hypothetical protein
MKSAIRISIATASTVPEGIVTSSKLSKQELFEVITPGPKSLKVRYLPGPESRKKQAKLVKLMEWTLPAHRHQSAKRWLS